MAQLFGDSRLPKNFAQKILACEIEIQLNNEVPKQVIIEILQLYSKGMEYFESIKNYRYMYFERKMFSIVRNPKFFNSVSHSQAPKQEKQKQKEISIKHKCEKLFNELTAETSALTGDKIKRIVAENDIKLKELKESIQDEIGEQQKRLQLKLQRRKFQKLTRKTLSASFTQTKSTTDSLFNEVEDFKSREKIQADFSAVINEHEDQEKDLQELQIPSLPPNLRQ